MASIDCVSRISGKAFDDEWQFKCDFCLDTFRTEDTYNTHTLQHFQKKNCLNCDKLLLRIGSNWYELHIDNTIQEKINDHGRELVDSIEVKMEIRDDEIEFNDEENIVTSPNFDEKPLIFDTPHIDPGSSRWQPFESAPEFQKREDSTKIIVGCDGEERADSPQNEGETVDKLTVRSKRKGPLPRITCRICDRIILKYNFENHLQKMHVPNVITSKQRVSCETCGKTFSSGGNLKIHQTIHSGTKRFVCSYCGTSFRQLYHLTEHMNGHTGNKPYHCQTCDKRFGRLHILRAHQRVHTGEKPHKCTIDGCDRAYAYDIDLKRHKFSAHGIYTKKHTCSFCAKVFPENKLLKKHLESHSAGNIRRLANKT